MSAADGSAELEKAVVESPTTDYGADSIRVLEGLEAVRKRPDMYIGGTDAAGLHHLVYEVLDNAVDEALAGFCTKVYVQLQADGSVSVADDGRGIPVGLHESGKNTLEVVMTTLHAGGKFDNESYKVSGGLHGVGVSAVCALSETLEADVFREGLHHRQTFSRGIPTSEVSVVGETTKLGTRITFKPDAEIFHTVDFQYDVLSKRCRELAFLNKGLRIIVQEEASDEGAGKQDDFCYEDGIRAFVHHQNSMKEVAHRDIVYFEGNDAENSGVHLEVALQYNLEYSADNIYSFANNINTIHGGTHLSGFKSALTRTLNKYGRDNKVVRDTKDLPDGSDYLEGLVAIVSVKLPDPKFESQTKVKLSNIEVEGIVQKIVNDRFGTYCEENPKTAKAIINKSVQAKIAREAARKARDNIRRKSVLASGNLPTKLADCSSRDRDETELYIVEGDSAGGSAKQGRIRQYQAILPIRGKILNVEKTRIDKMLSHEEIQVIISAIGTGIGRDDFDITKLRYGKVIIMTDADVDGSHIRTLLLTFFFRQMPQLIEGGFIYIAQPPLYRLVRRKKTNYVQDDASLEQRLISQGSEGTKIEIGDSGEFLSADNVVSLCSAIGRLSRLEKGFERKGIELNEYLAERREEEPTLPRFMVLQGFDRGKEATKNFFFTIEERDQFLSTLEKSDGSPLEVAEEDDFLEKKESSDAVLYTLYEQESVIKAVHDVEALRFSSRVFRLEGEGHANREAIGHVVIGEQRTPVYDLWGVLNAIEEEGKKGSDIRRFKGLGEMNSEELFGTTMNPEKRTLLKVTLKDAYKADEYFSILMGTNVESRRKFIQHHALDVKNLDI